MYEGDLERAAERDLRSLPGEMYHRIGAHLKAFASNPRPSSCRKIVGSRNDWRIRVGEYRIPYEIVDSVKAVRVMRIRHRREAYRP